MRINEINGIPESLLKEKTLDVYKAYFFSNDDTKDDKVNKMAVNESIDMFGLTPEVAVRQLLLTLPAEAFVSQSEAFIAHIADINQPLGCPNENMWIYKNMLIEYKSSKDDVSDIIKITMDSVNVAILVIKIDMEDLKEKDIMEEGAEESYFKDDVIGITLKDKVYDLEVFEKKLVSFIMTINSETLERSITKVKLEDDK